MGFEIPILHSIDRWFSAAKRRWLGFKLYDARLVSVDVVLEEAVETEPLVQLGRVDGLTWTHETRALLQLQWERLGRFGQGEELS